MEARVGIFYLGQLLTELLLTELLGRIKSSAAARKQQLGTYTSPLSLPRLALRVPSLSVSVSSHSPHTHTHTSTTGTQVSKQSK